MDIEFHYHMTYLVAARAGFAPAEAAVVAHAAQGVDDNHILIAVKNPSGAAYKNAISQTMDITRPHEDTRIYPVFHFVPGDIDAPTAVRKDGLRDAWVTTPDNQRARRLLDAALASDDLFRIGVAAHAYADTWAHQNFVGRRDVFNQLPANGDLAEELVQDAMNLSIAVGHGPARHHPDWPALVWTDTRLVDGTVDNRARFLDAARALFLRLARYKGVLAEAGLGAEADALAADLDADIGAPDPTNALHPDRLRRYAARARTAAYGGQPIPDYAADAWFNAALAEAHASVLAGWREKVAASLDAYWNVVMGDDRIHCTWRDAATFRQTAWYRFQEAVHAHLADGWAGLAGLPGIA